MGFISGALFALGCSDPAAPPAQAAAFIHIATAAAADTPPGKSCNVQAHNAVIGSGPTTTSRGKVVVDDEGGVVSCKVSGSGTYSFSGSATFGSTSFSVSAGKIKKGEPGTAIIQECDPTTGFCLVSPKEPNAEGFGGPCEVFIDVDRLNVKPGAIWARFKCPSLKNDSTPNVWCAADNGVFVFENCEE
jgi:hypothetical protein